jgi:hypothetical protein
MKWNELIHEGKIVIHKEILEIDPILGSPLQDVESHNQIHDMYLHE